MNMKMCVCMVVGWMSTAACVLASDVTIENARFKLTVGDDARTKSLVIKATGEERLAASGEIPLFASVQERLFDDELKLIHCHRRTSFAANRLRREGNVLVAGFEIVPYEARIAVKETDDYVAFELVELSTNYYQHFDYRMDKPPVAAFRLLQLPVADREFFGKWLNASWDGKGAVAVVGTAPSTDVGSEVRTGYRLLTADLVRGIKLRHGSAALVVGRGREDFLDCMDTFERDFGLPRGVASRRSPHVNASIYHDLGDTTPETVDRHIAFAKKGGFRYMMMSTESMTKGDGEWGLHGDYDWREEYPNREEDLKKVVAKIKAAGLHPGLHFLQTHVGLKSRYVTPVADPRLNLTRHFTLARPLSDETNDTEIVVQEPTADVVMAKGCRILKFAGELLSYEGYTTEPPYKFFGVKRGAHRTNVVPHPRGEIGGILDISEFGTPTSCYLDQNSDLQEEIGAKIANLYNCGFEFVFFDGAEGVNVPHNYHGANSMLRQWKMFATEPLFAEAAAKTHFGWHMLAGANAFDAFLPGEFKRRLVEFPANQAGMTWQDMTRCNFGWWFLFAPKADGKPEVGTGTQIDMWEFGSALSCAWDCPATMLMGLEYLERHPRRDDLLEVIRRWEDVRSRGWLTPEQKAVLRKGEGDCHLYLNEKGEYELLHATMLPSPEKAPQVRAFLFERKGQRVIAYWHMYGNGVLMIDLGNGMREIPADGIRYLTTALSTEATKAAFARAELADPVK